MFGFISRMLRQFLDRFGLSVGIQPDRAGWLLDEADGGTPQRFLWLPVTDKNITATPPFEPAPWPWAAP